MQMFLCFVAGWSLEIISEQYIIYNILKQLFYTFSHKDIHSCCFGLLIPTVVSTIMYVLKVLSETYL